MNKLTLLIVFSAFIFTACSSKKIVTTKYFPNYTKDDVLLAGKKTFLDDGGYEYIVDSYRDKLEVTQISLLFYTLQHKDYMFTTQEDECGTTASLSIDGSFGLDKKATFSYMETLHQFFWNDIEFFLTQDKNNDNNMTECIVKDEFNKGLRKENLDDFHGRLE